MSSSDAGSIPAASTKQILLRPGLDDRHEMVTVYVLKATSGKRYVGITRTLERRLKEHRSGATKGGQILGEFSLLHTEQYADYRSAREREKFLKSGAGRQWLDQLEARTRPASGG